jgi:hypothetical protein
MFGGFGRRKLEERKRDTLSAIRGQQLHFEAMVQRAQIAEIEPSTQMPYRKLL